MKLASISFVAAILTAALLPALAGAAGPASQPDESLGQAAAGIRVGLVVKPTRWSPDEKIELTRIVRNVSDKPLVVPEWWHDAWGGITLRNAAGKEVERGGGINGPIGGGGEPFITIPAGGVVRATFAGRFEKGKLVVSIGGRGGVLHWPNMGNESLAPREYTLTVRLGTLRVVSDRPENLWEGGEAFSQPVRVTVAGEGIPASQPATIQPGAGKATTTQLSGVPTGHREASTRPAAHNETRHEKNLARVKEGHVDLLFLGDSITEGWKNNAVWQEYYGQLNAANFGISGDTTQNVLWRVLDGEVDPTLIKPKVIVLLIGTNNVGSDSTEDIADGIAACGRALREKAPASKVLLLGIFPSQGAGSKWRRQIADINAIVARLDDGKMVRYLDIGDRFVDKDGQFLPGVMKDKTHPAEKGYRIWAESMHQLLAEMMGLPSPPATQPR